MSGKRTNPESLLNIRRIDSLHKGKQGVQGFQVHLTRQKKNHTKLFSDSHYVSKDEAREAAMHYRDALKNKLPPSFTELGIQTSSRSNTGHTGISYTFARSSGHKGKKLPCFSVSVRPNMIK